MDKQEMIQYLNEKAKDFYHLSDQIWDDAEIRFKEKKSSEDYTAFLKAEGFRVTQGIDGLPTALRAEWGSGKPIIGFLGEYDALPDMSQKPGVAVKEPLEDGKPGHGCGHNLLGVGSLIGAIGLKTYLEKAGKPGTVVFFGCPAEEGGSGKTFMAREGCFDDIDCAFAWHPAPINLMAPGTMLANCTVRCSFTGTTSHASAAPEIGRSALDALELMNVGIQFLREHVPESVRIHYAITDTGGISPNIVQAHASGLYQIRSPYLLTVSDVCERIFDIAKGAALMTGTLANIEFLKGTSNTILIPALDELMDRNMRTLHNPVREANDLDFAMEIVKTQVPDEDMPKEPMDARILPYNKAGDKPLHGSSDVGDVSWVCPVSQCGIAAWPIGTAPHTWQAVACGKSDFAHRGMLFAGMVMAASAVDVWENPTVLEKAWKQFRKKTNNQPYKCYIPAGVSPEYLANAIK